MGRPSAPGPDTGLTRATERQFHEAVVDLATVLGWRAYHTHNSRRSAPGWPDLCLVRGDRALFRELKAEKGRVTPAQAEWLAALSGAGLDAGVWRPSDWPVIEESLR